MAKDDDDKLPPIGDDTEKFLDEARKGKARNFLLVCKGANVRFLSVKKKPVKATDLNDAKKSGYKGEGYFGIITGQGVDLVFNLARSDGYDKAPVKDLALKEFLEEHAQLRCKPTFAIVDAPPVVPFDEDDLKNPVVAKFMKLDEAISKTLDAQPDREAEILARVTAIRQLLQDGQFDGAAPKVDDLVRFLAGLLQVVPVAPPGPGGVPPVASDAGAADFTARLKVLKPRIDTAIAAKAPGADEIKLRTSEAAMFARKREFAAANAILDKVEVLLQSGTAPTAGNIDVLAIWRDAKDAVDEQLNKFVGELRKTGDDYLVKIATGGVQGFVEGPSRVFVTLMASLFEFTSASGEARHKSGTKVLDAVQGYRDFVNASQFISVCDANKLCGPLTIRKTLVDGLSQIERVIQTSL